MKARADAQLLAWDAPGYGQSDRLEQPQPQAEAYAQRLWAWLDALHPGTAGVVTAFVSVGFCVWLAWLLHGRRIFLRV